MLPENVTASIIAFLENKFNETITINKSSSLSGGCINDAAAITTNKDKYFVKWNKASKYPGMFEKEAAGLNILQKTGIIKTPEVIGYGEAENYSWLLLELIEPGNEIKDFYEDFGQALAKIHKCSNEYFGLSHDNYIGSLPQYNTPAKNWIDFFIENRLEVQLKKGRDNGIIGSNITKKFFAFYSYLPDFFPEEPPSLLHGDLWSGNYMCGNNGHACLIDPAVYYGHRLIDLGMSKLFGGFSYAFYEAYNNEYPLEKSWEKSIEIANLYPLLVHVNLFGGGYLRQVESIIMRF